MPDDIDDPRVSRRYLRKLAARVKRCPTEIRAVPPLKVEVGRDGSILLSIDTSLLPKATSQ